MINANKLKEILRDYKKDFVEKQWPNEKYKWEAVKWFQEHWDKNASDFAEMLSTSLGKTGNLLASTNNFPKRMIVKFAEIAPEEVRAMFLNLFDESQGVIGRIEAFKNEATLLLEKYGNGAGQHYQYENAITTYLWLRYPEKYYIYKFSEVRVVDNVLEAGYDFKRGAYTENLRSFLNLYDDLSRALRNDSELVNLLASQITDECYPDSECKILAIDVGFYISRCSSQCGDEDIEDWYGQDFEIGISEDEWLRLIKDSSVFTQSSLEIMRRMYDYGGKASCKQLAVRYGETPNFYNAGSTSLAKRVAKVAGVDMSEFAGVKSKWWPILYVGRSTSRDEDGEYVWKLRDELYKAISRTDLSGVRLYVTDGSSGDAHGYWWLNANPKIWSFSNFNVGDVQSYTLYNEAGNKRRVFQNFLDAKVGDLLIGYEANPVKQIVALGRITAEQDGKVILFEKTEGLANPIDYSVLKESPELEKMEFFQNPNGSLFKLTGGEYDFILDIIREGNPIKKENSVEKYSKESFLSDVYIQEEKYDRLVSVLKAKKNIILQGAPGVGKTFIAKRLAYSLMGEKDDERIESVQFHQNYSYEDFVMGYKPTETGFELRNGIFYRFCQKAANQAGKDFFFIIDEINRGNLSKIFGELLMLVEGSYRGEKITLAYNGLPFSVPENLYIIGMMNTADRSLAMIDYAMRRRFSFFEIEPGFDSEGFSNYQKSLDSETFNELIERIKDLNAEISRDKTLGKGFCIGHSYFCGQDVCTDAWLKSVVDFDIIPMLSEYWFDDQQKLQRWENILHGVFR